MYHLQEQRLITPFAYSYIFPFRKGRATVIKDGKYLEVDITGIEYDPAKAFRREMNWILKGDYCPDCYIRSGPTVGCNTCRGWGIIPVAQDWNVSDY